MDQRPELERLSEPEKDALIAALWAEVQRLKTQLAALEAKAQAPHKDAHNSSVPPAQTPKPNRAPGPRPGTRREASVGRAGGGRPLHPAPDGQPPAREPPDDQAPSGLRADDAPRNE